TRNFPVEKPVPLRQLPKMTWHALPVLFMPIVLLYGIYGGITTPTESAAVAAFYALVVSFVVYLSVKLPDLFAALLTSAKTTASLGMLIAGALVFNYVVTIENILHCLSAILLSRELNPILFLFVVNILLLILGCVLEGTTI